MDYRHTAIDTLTEFAEEHPNMTLGEILYSSLRQKYTGIEINNVSCLMSIDDKTFYESIEKAKLDEHGE
ncbi:MAG: hypothetical protein KDH96_02480 [Candidatus Riesia sp.]|nr:hypothetical protein [Candidatus Riesia sp.]